MTALRREAINLLENVPEGKIFEIIQFIQEKIFPEKKSAFGILSKYADKNLITQEKTAWEREVYRGSNICFEVGIQSRERRNSIGDFENFR